ncbi:hypothetical protein [Bacillus pacificus]|uniref:hypothetical protein n=1 Tax=Bacillus pacificus TaxID=2026187 RepID=UPI00397FACD7
MVSNYKVISLETAVIYEYALDNNVSKVAVKLNEQGYTMEGTRGSKKISSNDVSEILQGDELDDLHVIIKNIFKKNKRKVKNFT